MSNNWTWTKSNKNDEEPYYVNTKIWTTTDDNIYLSSARDSYESLPNFIGGLFVESGALKLKRADGEIVMLGGISDIKLNREIFSAILDKFFE